MSLLNSLIFIDGGDPEETKKAKHLLGHIDGQTTNPTLVAKSPDVQKYLAQGKKLTESEAIGEYKKIVENIARVTQGPISIQVLSDARTSHEEMLVQARVYKGWIPNGVVKFPVTGEGLAAAEIFCAEFPVNLTLNFSQEQAAAVYAATRNAKHRVFISPFVGRLDDRGENGMDVVVNTLKMYQGGNGHVEVLTASLRKLDHLLFALHLKSHAVTIPFKVFEMWVADGFQMPEGNYQYHAQGLTRIPHLDIPLDREWRTYNIEHDLTEKGVAKFMEDWRGIIK